MCILFKAILFLCLSINEAIAFKHQAPFSCMTTRKIFTAFVFYNALIIKELHKAHLIFIRRGKRTLYTFHKCIC